MKPALRLTIAALVLVAFNLSAATLYVSLESTNPVAPFATWETAATNIQDAVDAAVAGDEVVVTNGVYSTGGKIVGTNGCINRVAVEKPLKLRSVNGPQFTLIRGAKDPEGRNGLGDAAIRCIHLVDGATLSGFTLTNGATRVWVSGMNGSATSGGGVWCSSTSAVLTNCVVTGNSALHAGGGAHGGTLENCRLENNWAQVLGGGGAADATLNNCVLTNNSAYWGGGAIGSTLFNCTLVGNSQAAAVEWVTDCGLGGGAAWCTLYNCGLSQNTGEYGLGGGVAWSTLYNCTLTGNSAADGGSGAFESTLYNSTLIGNVVTSPTTGYSGGALSCTLFNCTVVGNRGGVRSTFAVNSVVYYNDPVNYDDGDRLNYCCTTPLPPNGVGNITWPPLFMDMAGGNFRLQENSACIDAGTNLVGFTATVTNLFAESLLAAYTYDPTDILGNTRFMDGNGDGKVAWDIGAYEFNSFKPPRFSAQLQPSTNGFEFTVTGEPGQSVRVERSRNLLDWEHVATVPIPTSGQTLIDPKATTEAFLFYRSVVVP